jgi:transcriptional regulator with XRE-family HTH domain
MITGEKIRIIRAIKGYSQENMAQMLNITRLAYGKIERGETKMNETRLMEISKILEIIPENIVSLESKINKIFKNKEIDNTDFNKNGISGIKSKDLLIDLKIENISLKNKKLNIEIAKMEKTKKAQT